MVMNTPYAVLARLDGRLWFLEIPALGGATQARTVGEIEGMAVDYIAAVTDAAADDVRVSVEFVLPMAVQAHLSRARELRSAEVEARTAAATESRMAARELRDAGLTLRDVGTLLGVSHQRAQQLIAG